jgi:hypothetical protein
MNLLLVAIAGFAVGVCLADMVKAAIADLVAKVRAYLGV